MRTVILATISLLLPGCIGGTGLNVARYDFASAPARPDSGQPVIVHQIEVQAPPWLDTPAMQYRLAYADKGRREIYAGSRWVAPPARLLEQLLKQRLLSGSAGMPEAGCRLRVDLDEFVQVFDTPGSSRALLEVRAALLAPRAEIPLARRGFSQAPAAGADARAGAVAFDDAARQLAGEIASWLKHAASDAPAIFERCRPA